MISKFVGNEYKEALISIHPKKTKPQASQMTCLKAQANDHSPACYRIMPMDLSQEKANDYQMHGGYSKSNLRLF